MRQQAFILTRNVPRNTLRVVVHGDACAIDDRRPLHAGHEAPEVPRRALLRADAAERVECSLSHHPGAARAKDEGLVLVEGMDHIQDSTHAPTHTL